MSNKSYVGMLHELCPVCREEVDTRVLLDRRLKESLDKDNYSISKDLCKACKDKEEEYIALVEVANTGPGSMLKDEDANRTGRILHLRRSVWSNIFDSECPKFPMVFVDPDVVTMLIKESSNA